MGFVVMDIKSEILIILLFSVASLGQDMSKEGIVLQYWLYGIIQS